MVEQFNPQSLTGTYGTAAGQTAGLQMPFYYDAMESLPPVYVTTLWNMGRVQRTLLTNKSGLSGSSRLGRFIEANVPNRHTPNLLPDRRTNAGGIRQTLSPFRFGSLADVSNIDPKFAPRGASGPIGGSRPRRIRKTRKAQVPVTLDDYNQFRPAGVPGSAAFRGPNGVVVSGNRAMRVNLGNPLGYDKITDLGTKSTRLARDPRPGYTPFNVLADVGNWGYNKAAKYGKVQELQAGQRAFAPGALGTMATGSTLAAGVSATKFENALAATSRFAGSGVNMTAFNTAARTGKLTAGASINSGTFLASGLEAARFGDSKLTGRAVGYFRGAQAARMGTASSARFGTQYIGMSGSFYDEGLQSGIKAFGQKQLGARLAGSALASGALRAAGPIGWALLAKDLGELTGKGMGRMVRLGIDATKSAQGDLTKRGPFGMGYQDNSVAATSRQRGVMAISNSRLNARSALGQEAAYMYQSMG